MLILLAAWIGPSLLFMEWAFLWNFGPQQMLNLATKYNKSRTKVFCISTEAIPKIVKIYIYFIKNNYFIVLVLVVIYCSRYIILLCYLYYFIVLNAKIKLLMLSML